MTVTKELIDLLKVLLTWQQSSWAGFGRNKLDGILVTHPSFELYLQYKYISLYDGIYFP